MSVSDERLEEIAELASDGPSALDDDDVDDLLAALTADEWEYDRDDAAEDALEALVEASEPAELYDLFSAEQLAAASGHESPGIGRSVGEAFELLIEVAPAEVNAVREEVVGNVENDFPENQALELLTGLVDAGEIGVDTVEPLFERADNSVRNLAPRVVEKAAEEDGLKIETSMVESTLSTVETLAEQATNRRERNQIRENAFDALVAIASQRPEAVLERTPGADAFVAELDHMNSALRYRLYNLLNELLAADPAILDGRLDAVTAEFDDITSDSSSPGAALEVVGTVAERHADALGPQDRYLDLLADEDVSSFKKGSAATVLGIVGDASVLPALLGHERFDREDAFHDAVVRIVDREDALDELVAHCDHDDAQIRANALSVLADEYAGTADVNVVDLCIDRLDDRAEVGYTNVRTGAADALSSLGEESAERLDDASAELVAEIEGEYESDEHEITSNLEFALATVARTDESFAAEMVADLESDDDVAREIAVGVLRRAAPDVLSSVDVPVEPVVELLDQDRYDAGHLLGAVGDERPAAVEPVIEPVVEQYGDVDDSGIVGALDSALASFTYHYPEQTADAVEDLAEWCEGTYVSSSVVVALSNVARANPERVADTVTPVVGDDPAEWPEGIEPLMFVLGDAAPAPLPDDWSAESFSLPDGQRATRLARLLADVDDERATALLDRLATESESDRASTVAREALGD